MVRFALIALVMLALVAREACAHAAWSPARVVPGSTEAGWTVTAVNAHGDTAVAWVDDTRVRVASLSARATRFDVRTVFATHGRRVADLALALDRRGEATLAWVDSPPAGHGTRLVRAAFRIPRGTWSHAQVIGRTSLFLNALPRVASAPDGAAVLTYNATIKAIPGVGAAWRSRGHRFGSVRRVGGRGALMEPTLAFDPAGTAYLAGSSTCARPSAGVAYVARNRRFGAMRTFAPPPATGIGFVITGRGTAVATWIVRGCNAGENIFGRPMAAALTRVNITRPVALGADATTSQIALVPRLPAGGAVATWNAFPAGEPGGVLLTATVSTGGSVSPAESPQEGWTPVAADPAGNELVRQTFMPDVAPFAPAAARPADGGPLQPAPIEAAGWPWSSGAIAASDGAGLALTSVIDRHVVVTAWRP